MEKLDYKDLVKFNITFDPSDFDEETKPSRATGPLICTGCTDDTEQYWKLEGGWRTYIVSSNVMFDALTSRAFRLKKEAKHV